MKLSIIILNYNTENLLRLCLKNLQELSLNLAFEIIVVDNNSTDKSVALVKNEYPHIKLISNQENLGHARGNNIGIKAAQGEYVIILNTDIIFSRSEDIVKIIKYLDEHPEVAILGPKLLNGDGSIQNSCYRSYSFWTPIFRRTPLGKFKFAQKDLGRHLMWDFDHQENREVDWLLGACLFIRRDFLNKYGMLDERFFLYFADYELCDRAKNNGFKVLYFFDTKIIHYHRRESAQGSIILGINTLFNWATRQHIKDWLTYLKIKKTK